MKPSDLPKGTLIAYHRDKQGLRGVVIAIDDDVLGWSLCHKNDKFSKEEGLKRAYKRARLAFRLKNEFNVRVIQRFYSRVPQTLKTVFAQQKARSNKYFKPEHPGV